MANLAIRWGDPRKHLNERATILEIVTFWLHVGPRGQGFNPVNPRTNLYFILGIQDPANRLRIYKAPAVVLPFSFIADTSKPSWFWVHVVASLTPTLLSQRVRPIIYRIDTQRSQSRHNSYIPYIVSLSFCIRCRGVLRIRVGIYSSNRVVDSI